MNIIKKIQLSILKFYILGYDEKKCSPHEVLTFLIQLQMNSYV